MLHTYALLKSTNSCLYPIQPKEILVAGWSFALVFAQLGTSKTSLAKAQLWISSKEMFAELADLKGRNSNSASLRRNMKYTFVSQMNQDC